MSESQVPGPVATALVTVSLGVLLLAVIATVVMLA